MITRLFTATTDTSGSDLPAFGASPQHVALSDANDGTGVTRQLGQFDTARRCFGGPITQLPAFSGILKQVTLGMRGLCNVSGAHSGRFTVGPYVLSVVGYSDVMTTYTLVQAPPAGGFPAFATMFWEVRHDWIPGNPDGAAAQTVEAYLDVEWYPITQFQVSVP